MLPTLIAIFTLVLCLVCFVLVVFILMQRPSADAGMGASLGGGAAENAFGGETASFLTKISVRCIVIFFVLTFSLFIANIWVKKHSAEDSSAAPSLNAVVAELEKPAADAAPKAEDKAAASQKASDAKDASQKAATPAAQPEKTK